MKIKELKKDDLNLHLGITIPAKEVDAEVENEIVKISKTIRMDGFRKGKVPVSIIRKKYGSSVRADALRNSMAKAIEKATEDKKVRAIGSPDIDDLKNDEGKDVTFTIKYELLPEIKMPDWKKISLEKPVLDIADKDIDEQMKQLASFSKTYDKETKGKAKKGDQVTLDAVGKVDGKAFDGGKLTDHRLVLGSGMFIPGFEDQLIGAKAGEDVKVEVKFPENYHAKDLAGKDSVFECKVKAVHQATEPKIDDEMAKKFGADSVEKLKENIADNLKNSYQEAVNILMKRQLFDKLEDTLKFDVPASLLDREKVSLKAQTEQMGEEDEELKGKSENEKDKYFEKLAARRVRLGLLLADYVKEKKLEISQADVQKAIMTQARQFPGHEQQVFEMYQKDPRALETLKGPMLEEKAVEDLFANQIKLTEKKYKKDKLEKLLKDEE